jgi:hypothetical protein
MFFLVTHNLKDIANNKAKEIYHNSILWSWFQVDDNTSALKILELKTPLTDFLSLCKLSLAE